MLSTIRVEIVASGVRGGMEKVIRRRSMLLDVIYDSACVTTRWVW